MGESSCCGCGTCGWGGWGDDEKGEEEYMRLLSSISDGLEVPRVGDLGTLMAGVAVNGLGVLCEIVRTGVSEG